MFVENINKYSKYFIILLLLMSSDEEAMDSDLQRSLDDLDEEFDNQSEEENENEN